MKGLADRELNLVPTVQRYHASNRSATEATFIVRLIVDNINCRFEVYLFIIAYHFFLFFSR